jgi:hypothetical protein
MFRHTWAVLALWLLWTGAGCATKDVLQLCTDTVGQVAPAQKLVLAHAAQRHQAASSHAARARPGSEEQQRWLQWRDGNSSLLAAGLDSILGSGRLPVVATREVLEQCVRGGQLDPGQYVGRPDVSILMEYFKRPWMVNSTAVKLRDACRVTKYRCELVVNVDNPHEWAAWAAEAIRLKGFLVPVFSSNVHESRGYNRVARAARGRVLVVWQDDQTPAPNGKWVDDMMAVFDAHPNVAVLGMNNFRLCKQRELTNLRMGEFPFGQDPSNITATWHYAQVGLLRVWWWFGGGGAARGEV